MSFGKATQTSTVGATYDNNIDGLLHTTKWASTSISFSFTDVISDYESGYENRADHATSFQTLKPIQRAAAKKWIAEYNNVSNLSLYELTGASDRDATIRIAQSEHPGASGDYAYAYLPVSYVEDGDVWLDSSTEGSPILGNRVYRTLGHEIGHALGLKHGHETGGISGVSMNADRNSMEFSIMTYLSYIGDKNPGYENETYGFSQSLMMYDIRATQQMYGANFNYNSTNTVYTFSTTTGEMFINGVGQGQPGANCIFRTIWDGNGIDTYDFSNYTTNLSIDLTPGGWSDLNVGGNFQRAYLGAELLGNGLSKYHYARGHVFNALQYNGDARSLIENARGGSGNDTIIGNGVNNALYGNGGNDTIYGGDGDDYIDAGDGNDFAYGGNGKDTIFGGAGVDRLNGDAGDDIIDGGAGDDKVVDTVNGDYAALNGGAGNDTIYGGSGRDFIDGGEGDDKLYGDFLNQAAPKAGLEIYEVDIIFGGNGNDNINGGYGNDLLSGGDGNDIIEGGAGQDQIQGDNGNDTIYGGDGDDRRPDGTAGLRGGLGDDVIYGGNGNDIIDGQDGVDFLSGDAGDDIIFGGAGNDIALDGGAALKGGLGNDTIYGGFGNDIIDGQDGNNKLYGDELNQDILNQTQGGNDVIFGGTGNDYIDTGYGDDRASGADGNDTLYGAAGIDRLNGDAGDDFIDGGAGDDKVTDSNGNSAALKGGLGNDTIYGSFGDDIIDGGEDNDKLYGDDKDFRRCIMEYELLGT